MSTQQPKHTVKSNRRIVIWTDGAADPNPGAGGWGFHWEYLTVKGSIIKKGEGSGEIEHCTNNYAELYAIKEAFKNVVQFCRDALEASEQIMTIELKTDSKLCVNWLNGSYMPKTDSLKELIFNNRRTFASFGRYSVEWIPRELNDKADELSKGLF